MGSSKKKHKEKDRERRHRGNSFSSSHSKSISRSLQFDNGGSSYYEVLQSPQVMELSTASSATGASSEHSSVLSMTTKAPPKPPSLRIVLKVPQSATTMGGRSPATSNGTTAAAAASSHRQEQLETDRDFLSPTLPHHRSFIANLAGTAACTGPFTSNSTAATSFVDCIGETGQERKDWCASQLPPLSASTISMEPISNTMGNAKMEENSPHHLKKAKKSKKSKKSKHKKHKRHHHHHHYHHSSSSPMLNVSSYQPQEHSHQLMSLPQNISGEGAPPTAALETTSTSWMSATASKNSLSASFSPFSPLPPQDNSLILPLSGKSDFFANLFSNENNNSSSNHPVTLSNVATLDSIAESFELNQQMQQQQCVSSEVITTDTTSTNSTTSTTTGMQFFDQYPFSSQQLQGQEIKLKLSKNLSTSQYISTTVTSPKFDSSLLPSSQLMANSTPQTSQPAAPPFSSLFSASTPLKENTSDFIQSYPTAPSPNRSSSSSALLSPPLLLPSQTDLLTAHSFDQNTNIFTSQSNQSSSSNRSRSRSEERSRKQSSARSRQRKSQKRSEKKGFTDLLLHLLRQLKRKDARNFFLYPVTNDIAPNYSSVISSPMDLTTMQAAIEGRPKQPKQPCKYHNLGDFISDVKLMCENAMTYNHPDTVYYTAASKLWHFTCSRLTKKEALVDYARNYPRCTQLQLSLIPSTSVLSTSQTLIGQQEQEQTTSVPLPTPSTFSSQPSAIPPFSTDSYFPPTSLPQPSSSTSSSATVYEPQSYYSSYSSVPTSNSITGPGASSTSTGGYGNDPFANQVDLLYALSPFRLYDDHAEIASAPAYTEQQHPSYFSADQQFEILPNPYLPPPLPRPPTPPPPPPKRESEMTSDELIASILESSRKAAERLRRKRGVPRISYISQNPKIAKSVPKSSNSKKESNFVLNTLCTGDFEVSSKPISIEHFVSTNALEEIAVPLVSGVETDLAADDTSDKTTQPAENGEEEIIDNEEDREKAEEILQIKKTLMSVLKEEEKEEENAAAESPLDKMAARKKEIQRLRRLLVPAIYDDDESLNYALNVSRFAINVEESCATHRIIPFVLNKLTLNKHKKALDIFNELLHLI